MYQFKKILASKNIEFEESFEHHIEYLTRDDIDYLTKEKVNYYLIFSSALKFMHSKKLKKKVKFQGNQLVRKII